MKLEITQEAEDDLINIFTYTSTNYSDGQAKKYLLKFDAAFQFVIQEPYAGHVRSDVPENYKCWKVEKHVIIYRVEADRIYVIRVLHGSMNFMHQF